jgi:hypothetical protein
MASKSVVLLAMGSRSWSEVVPVIVLLGTAWSELGARRA